MNYTQANIEKYFEFVLSQQEWGIEIIQKLLYYCNKMETLLMLKISNENV